MRGLAFVLVVLILTVGALIAFRMTRRRQERAAYARKLERQLEEKRAAYARLDAELALQLTAGYYDPAALDDALKTTPSKRKPNA